MKIVKIILITLIACFSHFTRANETSLEQQMRDLKKMQDEIAVRRACSQSLTAPDCKPELLSADELKTYKFIQNYQSEKFARINSMGLSSGNVQYFESAVREINDDFIKFSNGSAWKVAGYISTMSRFDDAIVILTSTQNAIIYLDGNQHSASHLFGEFSSQNGIFAKVVEEVGDGALLVLDSGEMLEIGSYDKWDTGWWLPPYPVLLTNSYMYLWNLDEGKKIWVEGVR